MKINFRHFYHSLRVIFSAALMGAVVFGTAGSLLSLVSISFAPMLGILSLHEVGAGVGFVAGFVANSKHLI